MPDSFSKSFEQLTGNKPFPWQEALYGLFSSGAFPSSCNIPTGLGKTSVLAIWLIAQSRFPDLIPRRLVYVVNRRTVVDQTTTEAENLKKNAKLAGCTEPAISTLRGQFADNREWSADPSKPAIICGTVDMIGSRLLFNGYGIGFKSKPLHAGFLGQDVLLVHDEAHLEPAFQELLISIEKEQERSKEFQKFRVLELTATSRGQDAFTLSETDRSVAEVKKRINAIKTICLNEETDPKKLADRIGELALRHKDFKKTVLVYVRTVEDVMKVCEKLNKEKQDVEKLTGTLRGKERDELVNRPNFKRFLPPPNPKDGVAEPTQLDKTVFLVCTSAGEVGINISADHLVCDLSTFDSMAQRFGRVNRFGNCIDTTIDIVHPLEFDSKKEFEVRCERTLELLKELAGNGNPAALENLDSKQRLAAFSPPPTILPVTDILFDAWALTTIKEKLPGRPPVTPYLHGISDWEPPQTTIAWRNEVEVIVGELLERFDPEDLLEDYPLKPHETLVDRSDRVFNALRKLDVKDAIFPIWILNDDNSVLVSSLTDVIKEGKEFVENKTLLLPPSVGGLENGMLTGSSKIADDVADEWYEDKERKIKRRLRIWGDDAPEGSYRTIRKLSFPASNEDDEPTFWSWYELIKSGDSEGSKFGKRAVLLSVHTQDVENNSKGFVNNLTLSKELNQAIQLAAKYHDLGKNRILWQRSIGNPNPVNLLGKSSNKMKSRDITAYRHEFGSLLDALKEKEFITLNDEMKDLVLHLIATHHGRGRPHFPEAEAFDHEPKGAKIQEMAWSVPSRFARLQRKYGRWGLAYLESLLRAADYAASAKPSAEIEELS